MDKDLLEVVLKRSSTDSKIKRIIDMNVESAVPKGENYTSEISRVNLKVVLGNGRMAKKSFIMKKETLKAKELKSFSVTKLEASVYTNILKEMDYLMEEFQDTEGPICCKFIHYSPDDSTIILEDLKALGFVTVKRTEVQDLDHAKLALRNLGRYHAMAKVLESRGLISKEDYSPYALINDGNIMKNIIYGGIRALIKGMRNSWGEEWTETADRLNQLTFDELLKRIQSNGHFDESSFKCLNHGDCWNNNMMFKHDWEGRPIELRLIDFQGPHYSTPCIDVIYFIYTSIKPHIRRQNYSSLVEFYHKSLTSSLDRFGYKGSQPNIKELEETLERLSYFALALFIGCFPLEITKGTDAFDLNKVFETGGEEGYNLSIYSEDGVKEKIGDDIKTFLNMHFG